MVILRQHVMLLQSRQEQSVHHVFSSQVQSDVSIIPVLQRSETPPQRSRFVGNILHDMRCEPNLLHAHRLPQTENLQRLVHLLHAIVHPRQQMAVAVAEAL